MAIKKVVQKTSEGEAEKLVLEFSNGDLQALTEIKEKWRFKTIEEALKFAIAVLVKVENNTIFIEQGGTKVGVSPADSLLEDPLKDVS